LHADQAGEKKHDARDEDSGYALIDFHAVHAAVLPDRLRRKGPG
jgi:hypothetical protein